MAKQQPFLVPQRSVFNRIIGDQGFELSFAEFLETCSDVLSFAKNYQAVGFKLDYAKNDGDLSTYTPDFLVRIDDGRIIIVETKGLVDVDVPHKMRRLAQWIEDVNALQDEVEYGFVFVDEASYKQYNPKSFKSILDSFLRFKEPESAGKD